MEEKKNQEILEGEMELDMDDLDDVTGGSMRNAHVGKTGDITDNMKKNV
ncbi:MAG: hypothetical protein MRZ45_03235 [Blautia sp.]|nr:hypothetical protein [Blautia sp.]MDY4516513.1 hypothetical protein [Lachnospiraceae bacterium]